ncbi:MAG: helix-turn-helix domain-containing protein [Alphaproteobacteria bacterium]|nr:helix-turn-helix domain-containing protein [Alphaproteobacteria bacterium]
MTPPATDLQLLTHEQAAQRLGISTKLLRREVRAKRLRFVLVGQRRRYTVQDLAEYIDKQRQAASQSPPAKTAARNKRQYGRQAVVYDITSRLRDRRRAKGSVTS